MLTANSTTFANEPALSDAEARIDAAFTKHFQYFESEMYRRLRKDEDGNNDTYVLYDVQMHMQNAAIYADEQGDQKMLGRLLALCLIPFEPPHMTDGKWLNNTHNLIGVEVELCIAQYFSLLTRVLSACERHGIESNFSDKNIQIVVSHIDQWLAKPVNRNRVGDRHLFFVQSALQFYDYMKNAGKSIANIGAWKRYVQAYMAESIAPKWEVATHRHEGRDYACWMLDRTGWASYRDYGYAGYGSEITKTSSDTDPNAMFRADGTIKQPKKRVSKVGTDISHARRFNWFFETVKRFGTAFDVSIPEEALEGWANNLAFRVARGTLDAPHFTVFSDGVDGWYRVGYGGRKSYGYTLGGMDIHFVASSYGLFGVYNPRIYEWMKAWANKNKKALAGYHGGYALDYNVSQAINIKKPLKGVD
ncbi:MAG: hypothetical protein L3K26_04075 [Candidatus Hydrogenedentes bacterium]|nr:hypothetical protein [Candidatus Hydrogenedentota bacterium]